MQKKLRFIWFKNIITSLFINRFNQWRGSIFLNTTNSFFIIILCILLLLSNSYSIYFLYHASAKKAKGNEQPIINDPTLKTEIVVNGLESPTGMAFLGPNDILVIEKAKGTVQRIINGMMLPEPLLDVNVANVSERGLLGVAIAKDVKGADLHTYVFLYYTETLGKDGGNPVGNRLYRYELIDNKLINPKLLLDLPTTPGPQHNGGVIRIGPDNNVYLVIGDLNYKEDPTAYTITQNIVNGPPADGRGGILRVTQDGEVVDGKGILGNEHPLNKYFAYGIRNSFGISFDPLTGKLWDTENGPTKGADEINLVERGFNSGWKQIMGKASDYNNKGIDLARNLVNFGGKGIYRDPEFEWLGGIEGNDTPAPTAITFLNSDKLGKQYENDMFVGTVKGGKLFDFNLNKDRTSLALESPLNDKTADTPEELGNVTFAQGFGIITDLKVGPDGYLYVVSYENGTIYRIVPLRGTM